MTSVTRKRAAIRKRKGQKEDNGDDLPQYNNLYQDSNSVLQSPAATPSAARLAAMESARPITEGEVWHYMPWDGSSVSLSEIRQYFTLRLKSREAEENLMNILHIAADGGGGGGRSSWGN